ncbi:VOC family protein [Nocardiopsis nanhaiensis]
MHGRLHAVTIDCPDAKALADFYSELLGLPVIKREPRWAQIGYGTPPRIDFQQVDDHRPPSWPDPERPQQMHFEIEVDDIGAAEDKVLGMGARLLARVEGDPGNLYRVYADPAGHPFCLEFGR